MAQPADPKDADQDAERARRRTRRRKRTRLNLGEPFRQVDQFFNQSEDVIALGYRVLEQTVKEIQDGYDEVKKFNEQQKTSIRDGSPAPVIPWDQLVSRAQNLQNLALDTMAEATDIFADSARSATASVAEAAVAWKESREQNNGAGRLSGPVFGDPIYREVAAGATPEAVNMDIRHVGLTRLRISAEMTPAPQLIVSGAHKVHSLAISKVAFEPKNKDDDTTSTLTIEFAPVPPETLVGLYVGLVRAKNFQLMIARLHVRVTPAIGVVTVRDAANAGTHRK